MSPAIITFAICGEIFFHDLVQTGVFCGRAKNKPVALNCRSNLAA